MKQSICESNLLVEFLEGSLTNQKENELITHLDACHDCAQELQKLAAEESRWNDVKTHLSHSRLADTTIPPLDTHEGEIPFAVQQILKMLDPTDDPSSLGRIGNYEVSGVVGNGAMGIVVKAIDQTLDRIVAIKVMHPTLAACGTARHRFAREAKAAAGVLHPNVIAIHGVSTDRELPYLVMPFIAGTSLQQRMDRQGPLELTETLRIGSQIAAGLAAAHRKGLIHRDIKPSNVMLDEGVETALITDFGLARTIDDATMTRTGTITGTPEYMSPEQARGDSVDCSSDIFSLGSLLYTLCAGRPPFRAKTPFGVLRRITDTEPRSIRESNPETPIWLCELITRMHAKSPQERPHSADVRDLLENCLAHVYQPDRIPLPSALAASNPVALPTQTETSTPSRSVFLIGACFAMTFICIAILAIAMQPDKTLQPGKTPSQSTSQPNAAATSESGNKRRNDEPTVFKTLNLMFPKQGKKGTLKIDIKRGFIDVVSHDQPGVVIEILTPPEFEKPKDQDDQLSKVFAPKYDLRTDTKKNLIDLDSYNQDYPLNLRIKVPRTTDLDLDSYDDGMKVRNVVGNIRSRSEHGSIQLLGIEGTATARSRNGYLKVQFLSVSSEGLLDFESYNGSIDLTFPQSLAATTAVSAGTGSFLTAFKLEAIENNERPKVILKKVKSNVEEYQFNKINGGGIPIRIEGERGTIRIRKADEIAP